MKEVTQIAADNLDLELTNDTLEIVDVELINNFIPLHQAKIY